LLFLLAAAGIETTLDVNKITLRGTQLPPDPRPKTRGSRTWLRGPCPPDHGSRLLSRLLSKIGRWLIGAD